MSRPTPATARAAVALLLALITATALLAAAPPAHAATTVDVLDAPWSAAGDGVTNDRPAIQRALDDVAAAGGGTVVLRDGRTFLSGGLVLPSGTTLRIDGTLLQSQRQADYATPQIEGFNLPDATVRWNHGWMQNRPLVHARNAHDVAVVGNGTIRMTPQLNGSPATGIHVTPIGFFAVDGFTIRGVRLRDVHGYSVALYSSRHGVVRDVDARARPGTPNGDGFSIQNSQDIRITRNTLRTTDDGIYVWSVHADPRQGGWWDNAVVQPSRRIEIDHNDVYASCCKAVAFIVWGSDAPDQRTVEISDVTVHHNRFVGAAPGDAVGCWCDNPYKGPAFTNGERGDQSPVTRVRFSDNEYSGTFFSNGVALTATDSLFDMGLSSSAGVLNGGFEATGTAWWTTVGDAGATRAEQPPVTPGDGAGGDWNGWVRSRPGGASELYQGVSPASLASLGAPQVGYRISADVRVQGEAELFARDVCSGEIVASRRVAAGPWRREQLTLRLAQPCGNVQIGIRVAAGQAGAAWAMLDDLSLALPLVHFSDPGVTVAGSTSVYADARDLGGSRLLLRAAGASVTLPFEGPRAIVVGGRGYNLGNADVYLDGERIGTIEGYRDVESEHPVAVFDTGEVADGPHVLRIVASGERHPRSSNVYVVFNALLLPGAEEAFVPVAAVPSVGPLGAALPTEAAGSAGVSGSLRGAPGPGGRRDAATAVRQPAPRVASASLRRRGGRVAVGLVCSRGRGACAGTVRVHGVSGPARGATLALGSYRVPAGGRKTVALRLTAAGRRALRPRPHGAVAHAVRVVLAPRAGGAPVRSGALRLRAR